MKKSKKLLALFLSVIMLLGLFVFTTSAEDAGVVEETADGISNVTIKTSTDTAKAGDIITVTINVATDYNAVTMRWPVLFSNSFFEYVEGSEAVTEEMAAHGGSFSKANVSTNAEFTSEYTPENYGSIVVQWIGFSAQSGALTYNKPEGMDCFTFNLKVKDDVTMGMSGEIVIGNESLFYNQMVKPGVDTPSFSDLVQGDITFNCVNATVSFPQPDIVPVEGTSTVIDKENGLIRGIDAGVIDNIDAYAYAVGCELEITPSQDNRIGTGTTVALIYEDEVYAEYTIIIAGDVNGDALIDVTDYICIDLAEVAEFTLSGAAILAADLNGDTAVDAIDKVALDAYLIFAGDIDQATGKYVAA